MQDILNKLQQQKNWKQFLKKSCRRNKISVDIASYFTPNKIRSIYQRFAKIYQIKTQSETTCWIQNQLKAFHWIIVTLSGLKELLIEKFTQQQWSLMKKIFINKDQSILQYESIKLVNQRINKNRAWNPQQTQILGQIIKQNQNSNKWNDIARKLFQKSNHQFFRSGKQCRQRWLNHLDPCKKRGQWEQQQDKLILRYIFSFGKRWSNIAKQLENHRTQHMVKNRYKTLIIKQRKITPKISNQNSLLRQIAKRLLGQDYLPKKKQLPSVKQEQDESQSLKQIQNQQIKFEQNTNKTYQKIQIPIISTPRVSTPRVSTPIIPQVKYQKDQYYHEKYEKKIQKNKYQENKQMQMYRDPILSQVIEDYTKAMNTVSTPMNNYQLQQIYSPFYLNYQGLTPYLSPSPTIPFFMHTTFSAFDNAFTNNLFIKNNNIQEKKQENT